jgi:hypothetical protein
MDLIAPSLILYIFPSSFSLTVATTSVYSIMTRSFIRLPVSSDKIRFGDLLPSVQYDTTPFLLARARELDPQATLQN